MLSMIKGRVIGRNGNIVVVDFSREPNPPAPRFPGASGLRELSRNELWTSLAFWRSDSILAKVRPPPALGDRFERLSQQPACG
jgi:hypothetical protein